MDYSNGKIYKIVCNITGKCYIGSTCQHLSQRLAQHRNNYKNYLNGKYHYTSSYDILKENNYDIILLQIFPCNCKEELHARERFYIENLECVNKVIPNRTDKEYYEQNKDKINEKHKEYYEQNKDKKKDYNKEYYEENIEKIRENRKIKFDCECGGKYTKYNKSNHLKTKFHQEYISKLN